MAHGRAGDRAAEGAAKSNRAERVMMAESVENAGSVLVFSLQEPRKNVIISL